MYMFHIFILNIYVYLEFIDTKLIGFYGTHILAKLTDALINLYNN